jgi:hypothetical protein
MRFFAEPRRLALIAAVWGWAFAGCGRVPGQFEIVNDQVPQPGCLIGVNDTVYSGSGLLDLSLVFDNAETAYAIFPLMKNNLEATGPGPDTNQIVLTSFAVDISTIGDVPDAIASLFSTLEADPSGHRLLHYQQPWSGSISSGGGKLSAFVTAFPVELAHRISATQQIGLSPSLTVDLKIRAFGRTTTRDMESDPFDFPVSVCSGCLVANVQACPYTTAPKNTGNDCNISQDAPIDCCTQNGTLVCPPIVVSQ